MINQFQENKPTKKNDHSKIGLELVDLLIAEFRLPLDTDPAEIPFLLRQKIHQSHFSINASQSALLSEKQKMIVQLQQQIIELQQENQKLKEGYEKVDITHAMNDHFCKPNNIFNVDSQNQDSHQIKTLQHKCNIILWK